MMIIRIFHDRNHESLISKLLNLASYVRQGNFFGGIMLNWAVTFLVIAIIAAVFGFAGIAGTATEMAKIIFMVFLALFVISLLIPKLRPPTV